MTEIEIEYQEAINALATKFAAVVEEHQIPGRGIRNGVVMYAAFRLVAALFIETTAAEERANVGLGLVSDFAKHMAEAALITDNTPRH